GQVPAELALALERGPERRREPDRRAAHGPGEGRGAVDQGQPGHGEGLAQVVDAASARAAAREASPAAARALPIRGSSAPPELIATRFAAVFAAASARSAPAAASPRSAGLPRSLACAAVSAIAAASSASSAGSAIVRSRVVGSAGSRRYAAYASESACASGA